jgi:DHA1 family multidrug resistance protein-like MFS transporter
MKSIQLREPWQRTLFVALIAQFVTSVGFQMFVPFLPLYVKHLGSTTGMSLELAAGLAVAGAGITSMFSTAMWGAISDRYGRKLMLLRATFGGMILLALMGFVTSSEQLIMLRLLQGFITGTVAATNALVASQTPREKVGFAMSWLQAALWGGLAVGPLVGGILADLFGFAVPFLFVGALLGVCFFAILFFIEEDFKRPVKKVGQPGLLTLWKTALMAEGVPAVMTMRFLIGVARNTLAPLLALFVVSLLPASEAGHSIHAGVVSSVAAITGTVGGIYLGRVGDRIGHRQIVLLCSVLSIAAYVPQFGVVDVWGLIVLQAVTGLAFGGLVTSLGALLAQYTTRGAEGAIWGVDGSVSSATYAVAPLCGSFIAVSFGMRSAFLFSAILHAVVLTIAFYLLPQKRKLFSAAVGD